MHLERFRAPVVEPLRLSPEELGPKARRRGVSLILAPLSHDFLPYPSSMGAGGATVVVHASWQQVGLSIRRFQAVAASTAAMNWRSGANWKFQEEGAVNKLRGVMKISAPAARGNPTRHRLGEQHRRGVSVV